MKLTLLSAVAVFALSGAASAVELTNNTMIGCEGDVACILSRADVNYIGVGSMMLDGTESHILMLEDDGDRSRVCEILEGVAVVVFLNDDSTGTPCP